MRLKMSMNPRAKNSRMQFKCPICQKPVPRPISGQVSLFPFCSERCRLVDLGKWLDSEYRVAAVETDNPEEKEGFDPQSEI